LVLTMPGGVPMRTGCRPGTVPGRQIFARKAARVLTVRTGLLFIPTRVFVSACPTLCLCACSTWA
jgi:hypothetical protein